MLSQTLSGASPSLDVWAGLECTVNRVGDQYIDQLELSGHAPRPADLDLIAELGVRSVRYPILWERIAPDGLEQADWSWADERLGRLRELGIRAIVGLVHHGSGPRHTSLVDPGFPERLAGYARAVAERYPWVGSYTPINEPLTTARFSGLYGHWYPHGRDDLTFARALLAQCRAVVLAMGQIRKVNPSAQLVQTEDLGKTFSTPLLAYQAEFENERRWLSFDLLTGRLRPAHPMWSCLLRAGIEEAELEWFISNPCPPDVIGINHYLSSERFLDERVERYPPDSHGGNGRHHYADVLAARVCEEGLVGPRTLLQETWRRYRLPIAVTEAHNGCTREEQLRWLYEVWSAALSSRAAGVDVRAVTAWSMLGAYGWDLLVTSSRGRYESGLFDVRGPRPRPTALARMVRDLAAGTEYDHPVLDAPGWWRRSSRLLFPAVRRDPVPVDAESIVDASSRADGRTELKVSGGAVRALAISGASGTLGRAFARLCELRGLPYRLLTRQEMDIAEPASVEALLDDLAPWAVVNASGYVRVEEAEHEPERCFRENADGPAVLARACARRNVQLLTFSSDLVFDGGQRVPYVESDAVRPLSAYGRSKAEGEARVLAALPSALIVRTSAFFGPWDEYNFVTLALRTLSADGTLVAADDALVSPSYVPDLVHASLDLLIDGEAGRWHLANNGSTTWANLARRAAELDGVDTGRVEARSTHELGLIAQRPLYSVLGSERGMLLPTLEDALGRYLKEREPEPARV